jgi:GTP-binding protein EngB required for normal cell division
VEDEERQLYTWLGDEGVPAQIVFTKVDKLSASERGLLRERCRELFGARRNGPLMVSGETGEGIEALWAAIFQAASTPPPEVVEREPRP